MILFQNTLHQTVIKIFFEEQVRIEDFVGHLW